jgi:hypothetical protein
MQSGRLEFSGVPGDVAAAVMAKAAELADREHRAITLDDLRYAVHAAAVGRPCSMKDIKPREFGRVKWLLRLLIEPDDLEAMNHWLHPGLETREWTERAVSRVPEAYVRRICTDRFGVVDWRRLNDHDLRALLIILSNRSEHFKRPFQTRKEAA